MPENKLFLPEGFRPQASLSLSQLQDALKSQEILEGTVSRCDAGHTLQIPLGRLQGVMPRQEVLAPWINGSDREIAVLSRVGKPACFQVTAISADEKGSPVVQLSRRAAQETAMAAFLETLRPGSVLTAKVTHLESFGAFLDIGCGIIALLPLEFISVSRIPHPAARLSAGQTVLVAVRSIDRQQRRFTMTLKELLGTWMENASWFHPGDTVTGIVRSVKEYGSFIELTPNLSGLADACEGLAPGDGVSVYLKSMRPEQMKVKLQVIERLPLAPPPAMLRYQITDGCLDRWTYSPGNYAKEPVETVFTASSP